MGSEHLETGDRAKGGVPRSLQDILSELRVLQAHHDERSALLRYEYGLLLPPSIENLEHERDGTRAPRRANGEGDAAAGFDRWPNLDGLGPGMPREWPDLLLPFVEALVGEVMPSGRLATLLSEGTSMRRRAFTRYLALVGGALALDPQLLQRLLQGRLSPDGAMVDRLEQLSRHYMRQWDRVPPQVLLPAVAIHLDAVKAAMCASRSHAPQRQLQLLASDVAAFAGLLGWFSQQPDLAEQYLTLADRIAMAIGHTVGQAAVLTIRADFVSAVQAGKRTPSLLSQQMLEGALSLAGPQPTAVRAWILVRQAEELAAAGQAMRSYEVLELADRTASHTIAPGVGMLAHWGPDVHGGFRGNCEQLLGDQRRAYGTLAGVLDRIDADSVSNRVSVQTDLAAVCAQQGDVEQACDLLSSAYGAAAERGLRERMSRVVGVRNVHLAGARGHSAVRQLDQLMHS